MTQPAATDLAKLAIDRGFARVTRRRRRRWLWSSLLRRCRGRRRRVVYALGRGRPRAHDAGGDELSVAAVRGAERDRLRRRAAQGGDRVEGHRPARDGLAWPRARA